MAAIYYLLRSRQNGQYVAARQAPHSELNQGGEATASEGYVLLFQQDFEALAYVNAHAPEARDRLAVESHSLAQLKTSLERWGFTGVGFVTDPLIPQVDFLARRLL